MHTQNITIERKRVINIQGRNAVRTIFAMIYEDYTEKGC